MAESSANSRIEERLNAMESNIVAISAQITELQNHSDNLREMLRGNHEDIMVWLTTLFSHVGATPPPPFSGPGALDTSAQKDKGPEIPGIPTVPEAPHQPTSESSHAWGSGDRKPQVEHPANPERPQPERPATPERPPRASTVPTAPRKKAKTAMPSKYNGKSKGLEAKRFWTRCKAYLNMHTDEFDTEEDEMMWVLLLTEGLAADWAEPHLEAINDQTATPETASLEALGRSFLRYFGDPNEELTASEEIAKCRQTEDAMEYTTRFETLRSRMPSWSASEAPFIHMYKQGLKTELRTLLAQQSRQPRTLRDIQEWIIRMDKQITAAAPVKVRATTTTVTTTVQPSSSVPSGRVTRSKDDTMVSKEDQTKRMAAGLCLKCGKKGHSGRNCRTGWKLPSKEEKDGWPEATKEEEKRKKEFEKKKGNAADVEEESSESEKE